MKWFRVMTIICLVLAFFFCGLAYMNCTPALYFVSGFLFGVCAISIGIFR